MSTHSHAAKHVKDIFTKPVLDNIAATIAEVEKDTSANIRVSIREERDHDEAGLTIEAIAKQEFLKLGMEKTKSSNAILLFILFEERKFYVYGDTGIHKRVKPDTWEDVAAALKEHFKHSNYEMGIRDALKKIVSHIRVEFASGSGDINELSNEVVIG